MVQIRSGEGMGQDSDPTSSEFPPISSYLSIDNNYSIRLELSRHRIGHQENPYEVLSHINSYYENSNIIVKIENNHIVLNSM